MKTPLSVTITITDKPDLSGADLNISITPMPDSMEEGELTPALDILQEVLNYVAESGESSGTMCAVNSNTGEVLLERDLPTVPA